MTQFVGQLTENEAARTERPKAARIERPMLLMPTSPEALCLLLYDATATHMARRQMQNTISFDKAWTSTGNCSTYGEQPYAYAGKQLTAHIGLQLPISTA